MVMHIVMFKFRDGVPQELVNEAKEQIEQLVDLVPKVGNIKVGINFAKEDRAMDMVLISHFESREDLDSYAVHPEHLKAIEFIKSIAEYTKVVDFET